MGTVQRKERTTMKGKRFRLERGEDIFDVAMNNDFKEDFGPVMEMTFEEIKSYDKVEDFVFTYIEATNEMLGESDEPVSLTLVSEEDQLIWSIIAKREAHDDKYTITYNLVDWTRSDSIYKIVQEDID